MSKNFKFELNKSGVRDLLKSEETQNVVKEYADKALAKLDDGYSTSVYIGKNRANASVMAESVKAKRENLKRNTILKAVLG